MGLATTTWMLSLLMTHGHAMEGLVPCASTGGFSIGSRHFCQDCTDKSGKGGLAFLWPGSGLDYKSLPRHPGITMMYTNVTQIKVDGKLLPGWFHFHFLVRQVNENFYALYAQVEDGNPGSGATGSVIGQFTLDLLEVPLGSSSLSLTESMIIPCHATPADQLSHPNALAYWKGADVDKGIIPREALQDIRVNWKVPPENSCWYTKSYYVRVVALLENRDNPDKPVALRSMPLEITYKTKNEFAYPAPTPRGYSKLELPELSSNFVIKLDDYRDPSNQVCKSRTGLSIPLYLGRCGKDGSDASPENEIVCKTSSNAFAKNLKSIKKYVEDIGYDICDACCPGRANFSIGKRDGALKINVPKLNIPKHHLNSPPSSKSKRDRFRRFIETNQTPLNFKYRSANNGYTSSSPDVSDSLNEPTTASSSTKAVTNIQQTSIHDDYNNETTTSSFRNAVTNTQQQIWKSHFMHSIFAAFTMFFLVPFCTFSARYLKETFLWHPNLGMEVWYAMHLTSTFGIFCGLLWAHVIIAAGRLWLRGFEIQRANKSEAHIVVGWLTTGIFALTVISGCFRPYNANSDRKLKLCIGAHAFLGQMFYVCGMVTIFLSTIIPHIQRSGENPSEELAYLQAVVIVRLLVDFASHVVLTHHFKDTDDKLQIKRSYFPVIELIFSTKIPLGKRLRTTLFAVYMVACIGFSGGLIFMIAHSDSEIQINTTLVGVGRNAFKQAFRTKRQ